MDAVPVSLDRILDMAFDPQTPEDYAGYLIYVLRTAKRILGTIGRTIETVDFAIHENGCIHPFGEGGHPYCENFYTWVDDKDLPPFPDEIQKVN
jgi:hypothetical protein